MCDKKDILEKKLEIEAYKKEGRLLHKWDGSINDLKNYISEREKSLEWTYILNKLNLKTQKKILDYGAGRCWASYLFSKKGHETFALDINTDNIVGLKAGTKIINETKISFERIASDCEQTPFINQSFDIVFSSQVLHHASDLEKMTKEIHRVTKKGGIFVAILEHKIGFFTSESKWRNKHPSVPLGANEHAFTYHQYKKSLKKAGFQEAKISYKSGWENISKSLVKVQEKEPSIKIQIAIKILTNRLIRKILLSKLIIPILSILVTFDATIIAKKSQ